MLKKYLFLLCYLIVNIVSAQNYTNPDKGEIFNDNIVPRIDILIHPDSLTAIYNDVWSDKEYTCTFIFDNQNIRDTLYAVGFRLRGNTSRNAAKKSFKVSFNTFVSGRKYYGLEKLNLNGEHNDPTISRSKIGWDLLGSVEAVSPRANHVQLYINDLYYGLYINIEHIDERFVKSRFKENNGNLYKCLYPADLNYLGSNPDLYKFESNGRQAYNLKINELEDDYTDISAFINILNNTPLSNLPCELEKVFNVNDYLQYMAFDILSGNWDGYIYNKNNYYLYHNQLSGQFEYIPYDIDNTFGIDWLGKDWGNRNIYTWNPGSSSEKRPLYTRLLSIPEYKNRFSFYMNKFLQNQFMESSIYPQMDIMLNRIAIYAQQDSFRTLDYGYTQSDFLNAWAQSSGGHVAYGLKPYIATRRNNALQQLQLTDSKPFFHRLNIRQGNDTLYFRIKAEDESPSTLSITLNYQINTAVGQNTALFDDGMHADFAPNDGIWGNYLIIPGSILTTLNYQVSGTDITGKTGLYPACSTASYSATTDIPPSLADAINIYPNPFSEQFSMTLPPHLENNEITILNPLGQIIPFTKQGETIQITPTTWENGLYYILIRWSGGQLTRKVLKK